MQEQALRTLLQRHRANETQVAARVRRGDYSPATLTKVRERNDNDVVNLVKGILK